MSNGSSFHFSLTGHLAFLEFPLLVLLLSAIHLLMSELLSSGFHVGDAQYFEFLSHYSLACPLVGESLVHDLVVSFLMFGISRMSIKLLSFSNLLCSNVIFKRSAFKSDDGVFISLNHLAYMFWFTL